MTEDVAGAYLAGLREHSTNPMLLRAVAEVEADRRAPRAEDGPPMTDDLRTHRCRHCGHAVQQYRDGWADGGGKFRCPGWAPGLHNPAPDRPQPITDGSGASDD